MRVVMPAATCGLEAPRPIAGVQGACKGYVNGNAASRDYFRCQTDECDQLRVRRSR